MIKTQITIFATKDAFKNEGHPVSPDDAMDYKNAVYAYIFREMPG